MDLGRLLGLLFVPALIWFFILVYRNFLRRLGGNTGASQCLLLLFWLLNYLNLAFAFLHYFTVLGAVVICASRLRLRLQDQKGQDYYY